MKVKLDDEFACSVSEYWDALFLQDEYQRGLHIEGMGFSSYECTRYLEEAEGVIVRDLAIGGVPGLPLLVQKFVPGGRYVERGRLVRSRNFWHFVIEPAAMASRIRIEGRVQLTEVSPGRCRREGEIGVEVRVAGVGKRIAKSLLALVAVNERKSADFTHRFIADWREGRGPSLGGDQPG